MRVYFRFHRYFITLLVINIISCNSGFSEDLFYKKSIKIDKYYTTYIKKMQLKLQTKINNHKILNVYYYLNPKNKSGYELEFEYESILRINDNYYKFNVGEESNLEVFDFVGHDGKKEILLNSGCTSDGGCGTNEQYIIRIFEDGSFTITEIGGFLNYITKDNFLDLCETYSTIEQNEVNNQLSTLVEYDIYIRKNNNELISILNRGLTVWVDDKWNQKKNSCYRRLFVLEFSGRGLKIGRFLKYYPVEDSAAC
jgi:hypothetical protein